MGTVWLAAVRANFLACSLVADRHPHRAEAGMAFKDAAVAQKWRCSMPFSVLLVGA